ncbi:MAG TPA: Ig-like domain-containing protein [Corynebacterium variabile]|nr:Ig-like domain-containing protein [Corynebacterium variabile]HJG47198.1 Ig-like domain-containing protein [Corynebacterium variabile]
MQFLPGRSVRSMRSIFAAAGAVALLATAACTIDDDGDDDTENAASETTSATEIDSELAASVKDNATGVKVDKPITVTDSDGIDSVALTDGYGTEIEGKFNDDKTEWTSTGNLEYSSNYTLDAKAGKEKLNQSFTSFSPNMLTDGAMAPLDGATVGIGQTISLRFDEVPSDRKAIEDAITVETEPKVEGAFYWITAQEVRWRPKDYWTPGTQVHVKADLFGKDLGDGVYGQQDREADFTIGDDLRAEADDNTKQVVVKKNGEVIRTMPTSMGMPGHETPVGTYTIGDQYDTLMMDSTTYGLALDAGGYQTDVSYATQMSYSGIYLHAAPWSVWAQGNTDTSHGCLNLSMEDAQWVYDTFKRGDIVTVKNTGGETLNGSDGLGDWNIPWETWSAGNTEG